LYKRISQAWDSQTRDNRGVYPCGHRRTMKSMTIEKRMPENHYIKDIYSRLWITYQAKHAFYT
jgi:hypothetical protein